MLAGPCRVRILLTATATLELFTFFFCHAALTAFQGSVAYLYLLMQRREDCPRVSVCVLQSDCGWERPGREQPQHLPAVLSQWPLLGLRPKLPYLHEQPRSSDCSSDFVFLNACFFSRTVNSPIYTFSIWVPFLITSFSWGKEKAEAF